MPFDAGKVSCAWAEERFSSAFEQNLPTDEQAALDRHLQACAMCRAGYQSFVDAVGALRDYRPRPVPATFLESVRKATAPAPVLHTLHARRRSWPLILAWTSAAIAATIALVFWFTRPPATVDGGTNPRTTGAQAVATLSFPVRGEGMVRVHHGQAIPVADGAIVTLAPGDQIQIQAPAPVRWMVDIRPLIDRLGPWFRDLGEELRAVRRRPSGPREPRTRPGPGRPVLQVDTAPLARALERGAVQLAEAARLLARAAPSRRYPETTSAGAKPPVRAPDESSRAAAPSVPPRARRFRPVPRSVVPAVALVYEPDGALLLETAGPPGRVIPELLGLLDENDPKLSAAAAAQLEFIQARLGREHAIRAPVEPILEEPERPTGLVAGLNRLLGSRRPRSLEPTESDRWRRWWDANRQSILCLADAGP